MGWLAKIKENLGFFINICPPITASKTCAMYVPGPEDSA